MRRLIAVFLSSIALTGCVTGMSSRDAEIINELSVAGCEISSFESSKRLDTTRVTCK